MIRIEVVSRRDFYVQNQTTKNAFKSVESIILNNECLYKIQLSTEKHYRQNFIKKVAESKGFKAVSNSKDNN